MSGSDSHAMGTGGSAGDELLPLHPAWHAGLSEARLTLAADTLRPLGRGMAFVIGPPRSGTTILQNALNASRDVFMLGEPEFERDPAVPGFAARYKARHERDGNLENKSTSLPPLLGRDGTWWEWLAALSAHHRYVGAKIVLNPRKEDPELDAMFTFLGRVFYDAAFIFAFRNPLDMAVSVRRLQALQEHPPTSWERLFQHFRAVVKLYIRMVWLFPDVRAMVHEDITEESFTDLGYALGCDFSDAWGYYRDEHVHGADAAEVPDSAQAELRYAAKAYELLREALEEGNTLLQFNQNKQNFRPGQRTKLGQLAMMLDPEMLARAARAGL